MKFLFTLFLAGCSILAVAQEGYQINFHVKELKDTTVFLGYYFGEGTFIKDTARADRTGHFSFSGSKRLEKGVYFLVMGKLKAFEPGFLVYQNQHFSMEASNTDYIKTMKVTGDDDNRLFFENMVFNMERHQEASPFIAILKDSTLKEDQKKDARESYNKIDSRVQSYQKDLIAKYPNTLTAKLLQINKRVDVPEPPKKADGSIDSLFQYRYYRKHFFDNFDLANDAMMRLPTAQYQLKLNEYLDKLTVQTADSIMSAIDGLALVAKTNPETYKYLIWSCVYKYQKPAIMGLDEVYIRLYDKYFVTGLMDYWMTASMKKSMKEYADKIRTSLIGKTGGNLIMQDQALQAKSLYDIKKKYSIIYFFDPDCGHCKEESPKLVDFYNRKKDKLNFEVFAVSLDTSMVKMRNYIRDMKMTWITVNGPRTYLGNLHNAYYAETTPMVYVLDSKKKIIAKGLTVSQLEEFFTGYERFEQRKAALKPKGT